LFAQVDALAKVIAGADGLGGNDVESCHINGVFNLYKNRRYADLIIKKNQYLKDCKICRA
jgi:hypothetical protein